MLSISNEAMGQWGNEAMTAMRAMQWGNLASERMVWLLPHCLIAPLPHCLIASLL